MSNYNFENVVSVTVESTPKMSESEIQIKSKKMAVESLFENGFELPQTDSFSWVIPVDIEGSIRWVEMNFTCKKKDFDPESAENAFNIKLEQRRLKEREKAMKKEQNKKPVANGK